uniref:Potassium channel domain-containing protein n=1 Tax=Panagrolaimus sp. ES5 TaxID=591445 RepID=A0AC34FSV1_9BILA
MIAQHVSQLFATLRQGVKGLYPLLILILLTLIGGFMFLAIEGPNEEYEIRKQMEEREKLLEDTAYKLNTIKAMTPLQAYNHTVRTLDEYRENLGVKNPSLNNTQWTFWGSIYYSMTVYTTIGYGNIATQTTIGRVLTILYAFIGIPVALISLIALGGLFARLCMLLWSFMTRSSGVVSKDLEKKMSELGPNEKAKKNEAVADDNSDDLLKFPLSFLFLITVLWILFCAWIFTFFETEWGYGTSLYFTLISFLTIGFGDVLPSKSDYIILIGILLLIGLALVSTLLQIIQKQIESLATGMKGSIDEEYQKALQEAQDEGELQEIDLNESAITVTDKDGNKVPVKGGDVEKGKVTKKEINPRSLDAVVKRMPLQKRMMFYMMSDANKKQLNKYANQKQRYVNRGCQTEESSIRAARGLYFTYNSSLTN